ncbi:hypothetical protein [Micromonospora sp. WMMD714]|nr:hypothetical protein [Micromonospora sp. WMMD714]WFE63903.1 hypothetical protein O7625_11740 [Micromonospora sp. WMMD714]
MADTAVSVLSGYRHIGDIGLDSLALDAGQSTELIDAIRGEFHG